jgi:hypothetical protein
MNKIIITLPLPNHVEFDLLCRLGIPVLIYTYDGEVRWVNPKECTRIVASWLYAKGYQHYSRRKRQEIAAFLCSQVPNWPRHRNYPESGAPSPLSVEVVYPLSEVRREALLINACLEMWAENFAEGYRKDGRQAKATARKQQWQKVA